MYQSINQNPFQQSQSPDQNESADHEDEETPHNIKFTIPQNTNEKGNREICLFMLRKKLRLECKMQINNESRLFISRFLSSLFFSRFRSSMEPRGGFRQILSKDL